MKNRTIYLLLFAVLLFPGCDDGSKTLTKLHGLTEVEVTKKLGVPNSSELLTLHHGEMLPEFYIEIHNTYHPSDPKIEGVEIKELRWDRRGYSQSVFMHQVNGTWVVLDSCQWPDNIVF